MSIKLPPIYNTRSPQQWEIISKHVDFKDKTVIDLGCGFGDILFRCWQAGAICLGVDRENHIYGRPVRYNTFLIYQDCNIDDLLSGNDKILGLHGDFSHVAILFSVLPYLKEPALVLQWMRIHSDISLIEIQLLGDGPGEFETRDDIWEYLSHTFSSVKCIGKTIARKDKDYDRFIWLCQ